MVEITRQRSKNHGNIITARDDSEESSGDEGRSVSAIYLNNKTRRQRLHSRHLTAHSFTTGLF
jgi:hypothetical protein